jgi:hypothetical protein
MKQVSIYSLKVWLSAALLAPLVYIALYSIYPLFNHGINYPQYGLLLNKYFEGAWLFVRFNCPSWVLMAIVLKFFPSLRKPSIENRLFIFICVEIVFFAIYHFFTNPAIFFLRSDLIMQQGSAVATFIFIFIYKVKDAAPAQKAVGKKKLA